MMTDREIEDARWLRIKGYSFAAIAGFVGVSANTVRNRLDSRAAAAARVSRTNYRHHHRDKVNAYFVTPEYRMQRKLRAAGVATT